MNVTLLHPVELSVACPTCAAGPQQPCRFDVDYLTRPYHLRRVDQIRRRLK